MAADPYRYFRIEAREIVEGLGQGLLDLEKRADAELVARLLRLAHTLKGAARIVKHRELAELAHALEDVLEPLRATPVPQRIDAAFALVDRMAAQLATLTAPAPTSTTPAVPVAPAGKLAEPAVLPRTDALAVDDLLGGLAEIHAQVVRLRGVTDPGALAQRIDQLERELAGVRHGVEELRLQPAGALFTALERATRDAAHGLGKRVELTATGADVRLDHGVLATLHGALVQLVRNAIAHGIEAPAARTAAGKPPVGRIALAFALRGSRFAVTCTDDGRGLDLDAVRRLAGQPDLDDAAATALLLRGGISTSAAVSEDAGRGIGLDVVRDAARRLGGEVTARSTAGAGTTIELSAPASLAAIAVLGVEAGGRTAGIPLDAIRRVIRLAPGAITRGPTGATLAFDDLAIAVAPLATLLGVRPAQGGIVIVVASGEALAAIEVDRTLGVASAVVRTLPDVPLDPLVWGIALDADGRPRPVLEPGALALAAARAPAATAPAAAPAKPILVVDDSLTTRMLEQSILESAGFTVDLAVSAEQALERVVARDYGLLLVDVEMPGMDGFALIAALRAREELAGIPAILVTSRNAPEDRQRGVAVGAQGYVVKSEFDQVALLALIRKLVRT